MKVALRTSFFLLLGLLPGFVVGYIVGTLNRAPSYHITAETALRNAGRPLSLPAGTSFSRRSRKGDVNYICIHAIAFDKELAGKTQAEPGDTAPWQTSPAPSLK